MTSLVNALNIFSSTHHGVNFTNILLTAFVHVDSKSVKNTVKSLVSFYAFGIYKPKSCMYNVDEIDPWCQFHQYLMSSFSEQKCFEQIFYTESLYVYMCISESVALKMLVKLPFKVNFCVFALNSGLAAKTIKPNCNFINTTKHFSKKKARVNCW